MKTIVFVVSTSSSPEPEQAEALLAVRAQLGDVPARILIETRERAGDIRAQLDQAKDLATANHATGVFWIDAAPGDILLYLFEPSGKRLLVRRVSAPSESGSAVAAEDAANIVHATVLALAEGREIGMTPIPPPSPTSTPTRSPPPSPSPIPIPIPTPPAAPAGAPPRAPNPRSERAASSLRLSLTYVGSRYAYAVPWQSGLATGVEWAPRAGWFARLGAAFFASAEIDTDRAAFRLSRSSWEIASGYDVAKAPVALGAELALLLENTTRTTLMVSPGLTAAAEEEQWLTGLSPRGRFVWYPRPWLGGVVRVGLDLMRQRVQYRLGSAAGEPVLSIPSVRPRLEIGLIVGLW